MNRILQFSVSIILLVCIIFVSCKKERSCENCINGNQSPIANAGPDQVITLPTDSISLDGNASNEPDGKISGWLWTKISGPASFTIIESTDSATKVKALVTGTYQFELKVTDALGLFSKDTMQVIVNAAISNNISPVAVAGNDTTIQTNQTSCTPVTVTITLNGNNSYDTDGNTVNYLWTGPGNISSPNSATTTVNGSFQGTVAFVLKVTDNDGAFGYDTVKIAIVAANRPLVQAQLIRIGTLSQSRFSFAVAVAGNKLLFAGGWINDGNNSPSSTRVDIYDIVTDSWTIAHLSEGRFAIGVATLGNKIFFGGGGKQQDNGWGAWQYSGLGSSIVDIFDVSNNSWSTAQLSSPRVPAGASAGNKVIFAGGDDLYISSRVDVYDEITNTWTNQSLSEAKHISQIAVSGNKIFLAGGSSGLFGVGGNDVSKQIDILDASTGTWTVDFLNFERGEMGAIGINTKIFWGGGAIVSTKNEYDITNSVEIRDLATNSTSFDCLSEARLGISAVRKDNKIIFFGGGFNGATFDIYDLITNSWSIGVLPENLSWPSIISHNNILYVAGGEINGSVSDHVWRLEF